MKKSLLLALFLSAPYQSYSSEDSVQRVATAFAETFVKDAVHFAFFVCSAYCAAKITKTYLIDKVIHQKEEEAATTPSEAEFVYPLERFSDVPGIYEAKDELIEILDFLKQPDKYRHMGARIPHGILLTGDPGNGKTLLVRALAGEVDCSFLYVSGSEFAELYVGVGAMRVRKLFEKARQSKPCIIFIDELDTIGAKREFSKHGGNQEYHQTLNQLLCEMDGFLQKDNDAPVIVIGATNMPDLLDDALVRPGRFDRSIHIPYPNLKGRTEILEYYINKTRTHSSIDPYKIAAATPGYSGADLANLVNEAAIMAIRRDHPEVTIEDFEEARDRTMMGAKSKSMLITPEERRITAYHEAGHALVRLLCPDTTDPLDRITIEPRGNAMGITFAIPEEEKHCHSKEEMLGTICVCLGGRIAEEQIFNIVGTGASSDFKKATYLAYQMVTNYGMSEELGPMNLSGRCSEETEALIDTEVRSIIKQCYDDTVELLKFNEDKLVLLAETLLEQETLTAEEAYELLDIEPRVIKRLC